MKNVHWTALNNVKGTVWDTNGDGGGMGGFGDDFSTVFSDLKDEFKIKKKEKKDTEDALKKKKKEKKGKMTLITDSKRSQNINIMLGKLTHHGKRSMVDIAQLLLHLDSRSIGLDGLESLLLNVPTQKEMKTVTEWCNTEGNDTARLGKPENYVHALATVPHLNARLQSMVFQLNVDELYKNISKSTDAILLACTDLKKSDKFVRLLGIVLEVGNSLNKGTSKENAKGIQLSSLMKLTQTRTNSGSTLLEYIVVHIKKKCPELLKLNEDLVSIDHATKVALELVRQDVNKMKAGCTQIQNGIKMDEQDNRTIFNQSMGTFLQRAEHLRDECIETIVKVDEHFALLCSYFAAPPPPTTSPDEFFLLVSSFVQTFTATVKQVDEKIERQKKSALRNNERQRMRVKASNRQTHSGVSNRRPVHKKQLTGIHFDRTALPEMGGGGGGSDSSSVGAGGQIDADVVLKAARRASLMMGVSN